MQAAPTPVLLPDNPWFRHNPTWGAGVQVGPGPGLVAPDYTQPRAPQPGEGLELLPAFPGSDAERAAANAVRVKKRLEPRGDDRLAPYLSLYQPIIYNQAGGVVNSVSLGGPPAGYRWLVRAMGLVSQTLIDDPNFTGIRAHFYIGTFRAGIVPPAHEWIFDELSLTATAFSLMQTFGGNPPFKVLNQQQLYVYLTNGGANGYPYLAVAKVEQVPDAAGVVVENV